MSEVGKDLIQSANEVLNGEARHIKLKRRGLVYCEDCRYGSRDVYDYDCSNVMPIWCEYCNDYRNEMDFCSRGVKR